MKKNKSLKELREKDMKALTQELSLMNDKLTQLRRDLAFRKLKNVKEIKTTRKYIAQIWTILNQKAEDNLEKIVETKASGKAAK